MSLMTGSVTNRNPITYGKLVWRKWHLHNLKEPTDKPINGLDTETLDGYCRLLADDKGNWVMAHSIEPFLRFLTGRRFRSAHNFFFNQRFDFQAIVKYLPRPDLKELYDTGNVKYDDYSIFYIPKKLFKITHKKHVHAYYDIAQFYEMSLERASREYLKEEKYVEDIDGERLGTDPYYWDYNLPRIIRYCINDAVLCKRLGEYLHITLRDRLKMTARRYISKAGLSKDWFRARCNIPAVGKVPPRALSFALNAYSGGWFEVIRKGFIRRGHSIDICSAYPAEIANLPDITTGKWKQVDEYNPEALLGFYRVKVFITTMKVAPLPLRLNTSLMIRPVGVFTTYITKQEYEAFKDDIGIQIIRGIEYYDENPVYPFRGEVRRLYNIKANTLKEDFKYSLIKIQLNSLYGAFYEKIKQGEDYYVGKLFNPVYASEITGGTRAKMWKVIRKYPNNVLSIATDGLLMDKKPSIRYGKALGDWDYEGCGKTILIRSGIYKIGSKMASRGIRKIGKIRTPHGQYHNIYHYLSDKPDLTEYPITTKRPLNIGECLVHYKKYSPEMINVFTEDEYKISINKDFKRVWGDEFAGGGEMFEREIGSMPRLVGVDKVNK